MKTVTLKRKREGKTNYKKRRNLLMSRTCRAIVRKTNKHITIQAAEYNPGGDKVLLTVNTKSLEKLGWKGNTKNTSAAYLCGLLFGKKAVEKGIKKLIPDLGMYSTVKGGKLFAVLKGIKDAGIQVPLSESVLPKEERIKGKHIEEWVNNASKNDKNAFQKYNKKSLDPKMLSKHFEEIKNKITK